MPLAEHIKNMCNFFLINTDKWYTSTYSYVLCMFLMELYIFYKCKINNFISEINWSLLKPKNGMNAIKMGTED